MRSKSLFQRTLRQLGVALLAVAVWLAVVAGNRSRAGETASPAKEACEDASPYVAHEWGTFTSFSGDTGVRLEFRSQEIGELPYFVRNRANPGSEDLGLFRKKQIRSRERMETPVIYFYPEKQMDVNVRVDFPQGLITEFYPPVADLGPKYKDYATVPLKDSFLDWGKVHLIPQQEFESYTLPINETESWRPQLLLDCTVSHYEFARETDSAIVEIPHAELYCRHYEKFLFYRGAGNFSLPLRFSALGGEAFHVVNSGKNPIEGMYLLQVKGQDIRFKALPKLAGNSEAAISLAENYEVGLDNLAEQMVTSLVAAGLYEKEARCMVKTWQDAWFGEQGNRLLYFVPRTITDELLPLQLSPAPKELVRVLVGRMELMTPEQIDQVTSAATTMGTCASSSCEPMRSIVESLGRFAEPALQYASQQAKTDDVRSTLMQISKEIRAQEELEFALNTD